MTRIVGHLVMKNEADNFLQSCLEWNSQWFDELHVFDDRSTDNSIEIAASYTKNIRVRKDYEPSFLDNEGKFRQLAWESLGETCNMTEDDWVFAFDADEFLCDSFKQHNGLVTLKVLRDYLIGTNYLSTSFVHPELWDISGAVPLCRVDGYWKGDRVIRMCRWKDKLNKKDKFKDGFACGSVPRYANKACEKIHFCNIVHFGHVSKEQTLKKYDIYSKQQKHAHNEKHLASFKTKPELVEYNGSMPKYWRGVK